MAIIAAVAGCCLCCLTVCCCVASGVKGAYDDLAELTAAGGPEEDDLEEPLLEQPPVHSRADPPSERQSQRQQRRMAAASAAAITVEESGEVEEENQEMQQRLLHDDPSGVAPEEYVRVEDADSPPAPALDVVSPTTDITPSVSAAVSRYHRRRPRRHRGRTMQRMYNACACFYLLAVSVITVVTVALLYYFPHAPAFNVCNDEVAWKSLVDSVTSMKVDADIQLLTSIANPNRLDVVLVNGQGSFTHDGDVVGTLEFPPATMIAAMSITDILVVASFTPEKWAALSIAKEFYKGTLLLEVSVDLTLRVPALFNYERTISILNHPVQANAQSDRSLCACPTWSDLRSHTQELLAVPVPQWMQL